MAGEQWLYKSKSNELMLLGSDFLQNYLMK